MNTTHTHRISLLTAFLMLLSLTASCGDTAVSSDTTVPSDDVTTEADNSPHSGVPDGTTFGGMEINIINANGHSPELHSVIESTGDVLNDAVYQRNIDVMEHLDVQFNFLDQPLEDSTLNLIRSSVLAGDNQFDMITTAQYQFVKLLNEGVYMDVIDAPYIDITKPWWATNYMEHLNISNEYRYFLTGDITVGFIRWMSAFYYNKTMYEDFFGDPDGLYDIVLNNQWTFDKLTELTKDVYQDLNSNDSIDFEDRIGYTVMTAAVADAILLNSGASYCTYDKSGIPLLNVVNEKNVAIMEKIYDLFYTNPAACTYGSTWNDLNMTIPSKFAANQQLFMFGWLHTADYMREMDSDYGVVPYPKYSQDDEYRSAIHNDLPLYALPITCQKVDACAAVLEEMAFLGYMDTSPTYYNIVLKNKYMRDSTDKAVQLIDLIHDSAYTDTIYVYASQLQNVGYLQRSMMSGKTADLASSYASIESAAKVSLTELLNKFTAMSENQ